MPLVQVPFQVGGWEPDPAPLELEEAGRVAFGRVTMRKTFSGALSGTFLQEPAPSVRGVGGGEVLPLHLDYELL